MAITMPLMQSMRKVELLMLSKALMVNLITLNDAVMLIVFFTVYLDLV